MQSTVLSGFDYADGEELRVRFDVTGDDVVELQGKVWRAGETEPVAATVSATDSAGTLAAGGLGLRMYAGGGMVSLPLNVTIADYRAIVPGTSPTENRSPVAEFSSVASGLSVVFDGSGSSDADGDVLSYAWLFGDGGTSTEVSPVHGYAVAGTYSVSLTVSDGQGGSDEFVADVTVSDEPNAPVAGDAFGRTVAAGWGTADVGGAWTVNSSSTMSVDGSSAVARFPAAVSTRTAYLNSVSASDVSVLTDLTLNERRLVAIITTRLLRVFRARRTTC